MLKKILAVLLLIAVSFIFTVGCAQNDPADTEPSETGSSEAAPTETEPTETEPAESEPASEETPTENQNAPVDAVFYGDSITKGGNFGDFFPELKIANLGVNGATIEDLTEWVPRVSALTPKKIFVMAGGNNLCAENIAETAELYRGLIDALREACPEAEIYIESNLPTDAKLALMYNCPNSAIRKYNAKLQALAEEYGLTYIDLYDAYQYGGALKAELTFDGIHLKEDAFGPWAEIVRPYVES